MVVSFKVFDNCHSKDKINIQFLIPLAKFLLMTRKTMSVFHWKSDLSDKPKLLPLRSIFKKVAVISNVSS